MTLNHRYLITFFLLIFTIPAVSAVGAEDLKPQNVAIRSLYKEKTRVPNIPNHSFEVLQPDRIHEPYLPDFGFNIASLPDDFPQNQKFSWLTNFSPSLSKLFRGNEGRFENGVLYYQHHKPDLAETELLPLITESTQFREPATLYLAWIKLKEGLPQETIRLSRGLLKSKDIEMVKEAGYLQAFALLNQGNNQAVVDTCDQLKQQLGLEQFQPRMIYVYLIGLVNLGYWKEAHTLVAYAEKLPIRYARFYYKMVELSALIDYEQKHYESSLDKYQQVKRYNSHPFYHRTINRRIAWLYYLMGDYKSAVTVLDRRKYQFSPAFMNELDYLRLACHIQLKHWTKVSEILSQFPKTSVFFTYSAFQVRSFLKNPEQNPALFKQVSSVKFDFPEMKFHVAILDGNLYFKQNKYDKALKSYLRALSVDSSSPDYWKARFNIALTRLKQSKLQAAEKDFRLLLRTSKNGYRDRIRYHLAFAQYLLEKKTEPLETLKEIDTSHFNHTEQVELNLIRGGSLLRTEQYEKAARLFKTLWDEDRQQEAVEFLAKIYYDTKQFEKNLELGKDPACRQNKPFIRYEIKSLLALRRFSEAQQLVKQLDEDDAAVELRLRVWAANQQYQKIITYIGDLLKKESTSEKRRFYYLSLGDAYFNLEKYRESKAQFFRALVLTREPAQKSQIQYNIALTSYYYKDSTSFLKEARQVLADQHVSDENRYNLTLLLAQHYIADGNIEQADRVYAAHYRQHDYNRPNIHLKRIRLWYGRHDYNKCLELSKTPAEKENRYQRRDRVILFGYCANQASQPDRAIKAATEEKATAKDSYRLDELSFILAQAYSQDGKYKQSMALSRELIKKPLNKKVQQETQLLIAHNLLKLKKADKARIELGDANQYRATGQYIKSLQLRSEIELQLHQHDKAHRTLLRIYYLKNSSAKDKQLALLRLAEDYLNNGKLEPAKRHLQMIDRNIIAQLPEANQRYQTLGKAIQKEQSNS